MKTMKNFILSLVAMLVVSTSFSRVEYKKGVNGDTGTVYHNNTNNISVDVNDTIIFISGSFDVIMGEAMFQFNGIDADTNYFDQQPVGYVYSAQDSQFQTDTLTFRGAGEIKVGLFDMFFVINVTEATQEEETASIFENEIHVTALNAYPNPVVDYLNVEFETELSEVAVSVMNGAGQTIFVDNEMRWNSSNKVIVPMSDQPNGLYFVRIGNETRKVIKQ